MAEPDPETEAELEAEWGERARAEPRWPASVAVAVAIGLQVVLPHRIVLGPVWVLPSLEAALGLAVLVTRTQRQGPESRNVRALAIALIALINVANLISLGYLVHALVARHPVGGRTLIFASVPVWLTNIIVFALWYWELDRGGPAARVHATHGAPDFLFPQMDSRGSTRADWSPTFLDYPVHVVHQRDRVQPHRHHAPVGVGEGADDGPVIGVAAHRRSRHLPRRQHPLKPSADAGRSPR